jgi:hypothetical protein
MEPSFTMKASNVPLSLLLHESERILVCYPDENINMVILIAPPTSAAKK